MKPITKERAVKWMDRLKCSEEVKTIIIDAMEKHLGRFDGEKIEYRISYQVVIELAEEVSRLKDEIRWGIIHPK